MKLQQHFLLLLKQVKSKHFQCLFIGYRYVSMLAAAGFNGCR